MAKGGAFEVRCPSCNVTFPVGTRQCIHCGGRTTKPARLPEGVHAAEGQISSEPIHVMPTPKGREQTLPGTADAIPAEDGIEEEEYERSWARTIFNLLFIALAIGISVMRACSEGQ